MACPNESAAACARCRCHRAKAAQLMGRPNKHPATLQTNRGRRSAAHPIPSYFQRIRSSEHSISISLHDGTRRRWDGHPPSNQAKTRRRSVVCPTPRPLLLLLLGATHPPQLRSHVLRAMRPRRGRGRGRRRQMMPSLVARLASRRHPTSAKRPPLPLLPARLLVCVAAPSTPHRLAHDRCLCVAMVVVRGE